MIIRLFLLLFSVQALAADLPGRLFYTPAQRLAKKPTAAVARSVSSVAYQGYVQRSDGVNSIWIGGKVQAVTGQVNLNQFKPASAPALKVGQRYDGQQHRVLENYEQIAEPQMMDTPRWQPPNLDKYDAY
ncbi:MAG: hypothetical protein HOP20_02920 [Sulfuriferula sp.]|nr:hypothetical protein [Sulfuriferula sp.]